MNSQTPVVPGRMPSCTVVVAWPTPSLSRLPTATPGPGEVQDARRCPGHLDQANVVVGAWRAGFGQVHIRGHGVAGMRMIAEAVATLRRTAGEWTEIACAQDASQRDYRSAGEPAGTATAPAGFTAEVAASTAGNARRVSVGIVNDILSIIPAQSA